MSAKLKKVVLVQAIQVTAGNDQCFEVGKASECGQEDCLCKADCN